MGGGVESGAESSQADEVQAEVGSVNEADLRVMRERECGPRTDEKSEMSASSFQSAERRQMQCGRQRRVGEERGTSIVSKALKERLDDRLCPTLDS